MFDSFSFRRFRVQMIGHRRRTLAAERSGTRHLRRWLIGGVAGLVAAIVLRKYVVLVVFSILAFIATPILPSIDDTTALLANQSTIIYDREGTELYTIHGDENRFEIPLAKMPAALKNATIAAEDDKFYEHPGIDVDSIIRAVLGEIGIGSPSGGSTITQQFVKNAYLSPERSYTRKLKEWLLAIKLENNFEKDEILEMYLNRIPYGNNAYGIQAASQIYFAKDAAELTLAESAVLAGLPQAPSRFSPYGPNRDQLMGSCATDGTATTATLPDTLTLTVTPTARIWLSITTDGKKAKEGMIPAGTPIILPFARDFAVLHSTGDLTIDASGVTVTPTAKIGTTRTALTREAIARMAIDQGVIRSGGASRCTSPTDPAYTAGRKDYVLARMLHLGMITQDEYLAAWRAAFSIEFKPYRESIKHAHFVFYIRDWLEEQYGRDIVERGGLRVFTTLDPDLQTKAEELIASSFPHKTDPTTGETIWQPDYADATNAALLSVDNATGQILAMVGSRDYFETPHVGGGGSDGAVNLTIRPRQPGSSFKPFVYTTGFLDGYAPSSVLWDVGTNFGGEYEPKDFDGKEWGPITIRRALNGSRNIPAVKMAALIGEDVVVDFANTIGIKSVKRNNNYGPAIGLGVAEVPMLEMVQGYSVLANGGTLVPTTPILKITDSKGNIIEDFTSGTTKPRAVLDPEVAYLTTSILTDRNARPAGWNPFITLKDRPSGAKTGTANRRYGKGRNDILPGDIWTLGYTPQITTGVWFGNNDGSAMNMRGEGLTIAGPVWRDFMTYAHRNLPVAQFTKPAGIVERSVSRLTGKLPSSRTPIDQITTDVFTSWSAPLEVDDGFVTIAVDSVSGKLPTALTPVSSIVERTFARLHSERPQNSFWEQPVQAWIRGAAATTLDDGRSLLAYGPPPTEYDDVHTAAATTGAPTVTIQSPTNGSTVRTGTIGVWVDVASGNGIRRVDYFLDDAPAGSATAKPWKGIVTIPTSAIAGSTFTIAAKVTDTLGYADTSSVTVTVGDDTQPPTIRFTAPTASAEIATGTTLIASVDAYDAGGDIRRVHFELDGVGIADIASAPYQTTITIKSTTTLGRHTLRATATDTAGMSATAETTFTVVRGVAAPTTAPLAITAPTSGARIASTTARIAITGHIDRTAFAATEVNIVAHRVGTDSRTVIATIPAPTSNTIEAVWTGFTAGSYELYLHATDASGAALTSSVATITIE